MAYLAAFARDGDPNANNAGLPAWTRREPPSTEAAKTCAVASAGIVFDARGAEALIHPLLERVTKASVYAELEAELAPDLAKAVRARLFVK